jgi:hypothetical protein
VHAVTLLHRRVHAVTLLCFAGSSVLNLNIAARLAVCPHSPYVYV